LPQEDGLELPAGFGNFLVLRQTGVVRERFQLRVAGVDPGWGGGNGHAALREGIAAAPAFTEFVFIG